MSVVLSEQMTEALPLLLLASVANRSMVVLLNCCWCWSWCWSYFFCAKLVEGLALVLTGLCFEEGGDFLEALLGDCAIKLGVKHEIDRIIELLYLACVEVGCAQCDVAQGGHAEHVCVLSLLAEICASARSIDA